MAFSPSSSSFCSARSFKSGCNSNGDISSGKDDWSYADVVRGSPAGTESVHSVGDISRWDDNSYANAVKGHPKGIRSDPPIPSFCTGGAELKETGYIGDIPNNYTGIRDEAIGKIVVDRGARRTNAAATPCGKSDNNDISRLVDCSRPVDYVVGNDNHGDITGGSKGSIG